MMFDKLDMLMIGAKLRGERYLDRLLHEEEGAADMVGILVLIVIIIAIAGIFRTQLTGVVNAVFTKVTEFIND